MRQSGTPGSPAGIAPLTRMELVISQALRGGVVTSAGIILAGLVGFAVTRDTGYAKVLPHHLPDLLTFHQTSGPGFFPSSLSAVASGALGGKPYGIILLGVLLLIATPVVRVALSALFFLSQRDWQYVGITLFVLGVLLLSLFGGIGWG